MTMREQIDFIVNEANTNLPALLGNASLDNFDQYTGNPPRGSDLRIFSVYPSMNGNTTDQDQREFVIQLQLARKDQSVEYYDVVEPWLKKNIKPDDLGYTDRMHIITDFYPIDRNGTSFVYFYIKFGNPLTDCDD